MPVPAFAAAPEAIRALAEISPQLALEELERSQPLYSADQSDTWQDYERVRLDIYARLRDTRALLARTQQPVPDAASALWLRTRRWQAEIELGAGERVLDELRDLLWTRPAPLPQARLRQLIVQAYLRQREYAGAASAARRYHQDYAGGLPAAGAGEHALQLDAAADHAQMRAHWLRALLHGGDYAAAARLADDSSTEARLLGGLARLLGEPGSAAAVAQLAAEIEAEIPAYRSEGRAARVLLARALNRLNEPLAALHAQADALVAAAPPADPLFALTADDLWSSYESYGRGLGVSRQLELGYSQNWLAAAEAARQNEPLSALALATVVLLDARERAAREQAAAYVLEGLQSREQGARLALTLFLEGTRISHTDLGAASRFALLRLALKLADGKAASALLVTLSDRPAEIAEFDWALARTHAAVLTGAGAQALRDFAPVALDATQIRQLRRVLRDATQQGQARAVAELCTRWSASPPYAEATTERSLLVLEQAYAELALDQPLSAAASAWRAHGNLDGDDRQLALRLSAQAWLRAGKPEEARRAYDALMALKPETTPELAEELRAAGVVGY